MAGATILSRESAPAISYDVRPHAWAPIFQLSSCFENVYASVPVRTTVWPLDGDRERTPDDGVGASAVHVPESYLVSQMLMRDVKVLAPLFDVNEPIGRGVRVQPAIRRDAVDDDGVVSEDAEKKLDVLGVESVDVSVDQGLRLAGCRA